VTVDPFDGHVSLVPSRSRTVLGGTLRPTRLSCWLTINHHRVEQSKREYDRRMIAHLIAGVAARTNKEQPNAFKVLCRNSSVSFQHKPATASPLAIMSRQQSIIVKVQKRKLPHQLLEQAARRVVLPRHRQPTELPEGGVAEPPKSPKATK
jgi:hypothetical protein